MRNYKLSFGDLNISDEEILRDMGYEDECPIPYIKERVQLFFQELNISVFPSFTYLFVNGSVESEKLHVGDNEFCLGKIIAKQIQKSERFAIFVVTAGIEFEQWAQQKKDDPLDSYIADIFGSIIAEKAADRAEEVIGKQASDDDLLHTNRYSPGYCGWHVSEQRKLFGLFPEEEPCGVRLTPSSLMMPIKSVSGIIGVGKDVRKVAYTCSLCDMKQCYKRKKN